MSKDYKVDFYSIKYGHKIPVVIRHDKVSGRLDPFQLLMAPNGSEEHIVHLSRDSMKAVRDVMNLALGEK